MKLLGDYQFYLKNHNVGEIRYYVKDFFPDFFISNSPEISHQQITKLQIMKRLFAGVLMFAMVLTVAGVLATSAKADTAAFFNTDLTVGSKGSDVSALQTLLISKGYSIPAGVTGYFGAQTKAAVSAWQTAAGITPTAGYFGPKSRAAINAMAVGGTSTTPGCAAGAMFSSTTGQACAAGTTTVAGCVAGAMFSSTTGQACSGGTTSTGTISTKGVEGIITVDANPTPGSGQTLHENDQMVQFLGVRVRAQLSDVLVQRVKLDLGTNSNVYTKQLRKVYLMDGSTVIASQDLNSSTVTRETGSPDHFTVTLTGFSFLVPKDSTKALTVAFDVQSSVNSSYLGSVTVTVPQNAVRATDGAGLDQYGPSSQFSQSQTIAASLVDSAQVQLSTDSNTPKASEIVAADGTANNEKDKVALLTADLYAQKDNAVVRNWTVRVQKTGAGAATIPTVWLMDGSTTVGSASVTYTGVTGTATFNNLTLSIPKDTTKSFTIAADVRSANGSATTLAASTTASDISAENSLGSTITAGTNLTGSATGQSLVARNIGPVFTLTSKTITKGSTPLNGNNSTSTGSATFTLNVQAVGGDILFGASGSTSPMFTNGSFATYYNGAATTLLVASSTAYDTPSSGVVTSSNTFTLQRNNSISIPVTFLFEGRTVAGVAVGSGSYAVGLNAINWISSNGSTSSTFMSGNTDWRTSTISLP
jgi:peptidoglycan hydrolase-like protein with peptidoglycan-binding domain